VPRGIDRYGPNYSRHGHNNQAGFTSEAGGTCILHERQHSRHSYSSSHYRLRYCNSNDQSNSRSFQLHTNLKLSN
ncbi:31630_t:CDS:1, partial [Gigaspora margarita]